MRIEELNKIASLISTGYYDDIFFKWVVENDEDRHKVVTEYYKVYLNAKGAVVNVAENGSNKILGASVWLPHDVDASIYDDINTVAGIYADKFQAVADNSHYSEPPNIAFYQLVGFAVDKKTQGTGVGAKLLKHSLDEFDKQGISTYLEASTPYFGSGVYGKFGYQPVGELMVFTESAVLYPLWRSAQKQHQITFGEYNWVVLEERDDSILILSEKIIETKKYHDLYENITWENSTVRKYLNDDFYGGFTSSEKSQILETKIINNANPWYNTCGGNSTMDKIFLLSVEEVVKYFGDSGQLKNPKIKFFIDDNFNDNRKATLKNNSPSRWILRTSGNSQNFVSVVTVDGRVSVTGDFVNRQSMALFSAGIRPAMWIKR